MKLRVVVRAGAALAYAAAAAAAPTLPHSEPPAAPYEGLAASGNVRAQAVLGRLYVDGELVPRDDVRGFHWLLCAARQGDVESQTAVADLYRQGRGVRQDYEEAAHWYGIAA